MTEHLEHLLMKYRSKGVMVDTNLLLLFFIGSIDRSLVETFKRTRTFVVEDFDLLLKFLECFERICTCPQVLTEVANLAGALTDEYRHALFHRFADSLEVLVEQYVPAKEAVRAAPYFKFGL